jgi:hypothetical protein
MRSTAIRTVIVATVILTVIGVQAGRSQVQEPPAFKRSDPVLLNTTGTFQLVEFYHPT